MTVSAMRCAISASCSSTDSLWPGEELRESVMEAPCLKLAELATGGNGTALSLRHVLASSLRRFSARSGHPFLAGAWGKYLGQFVVAVVR